MAIMYGDNPMRSVVMEVDITEATRKAFGLCHWRLRVAKLCVWLAARTLRCGLRITQ